MKHILLFLILSFPFCSWAGLDEVTLYSANKKCAIRYLTQFPTNGQTIQTNNPCPDGWVQGYASVEISTPQYDAKETLSGFFIDGYWTESFPTRGHVQDRANPQENVQNLTFILDTDKEANITYLVQLRAVKSENGLYSAFKGCPIFRLLVVTPDVQFFQNEAFQSKIAHQATNYAKRLCSDLNTIAVFGTNKIDARSPDIVFQMQIDPSTKEHTLIPPSMDFQNTDINTPIELRKESSDILLSVNPQKDNVSVSYGKTEIHSIPVPDPKDPPPLTSLNHLIVQSKMTNQSAQGRIIVHIKSVNLDGTAWVDMPQQILLKYHPQLKIGWAIIQGRLDKNQMRVSDIQFCQKEWCSDVP